MALRLTFDKLNDQYLRITGLADGLTGAFRNGATVTASLYDENGSVVTGFSNVALTYDPGSDGVYIGQVPDTFDPEPGSGYFCWIDADQSGTKGHWEIKSTVRIRRE